MLSWQLYKNKVYGCSTLLRSSSFHQSNNTPGLSPWTSSLDQNAGGPWTPTSAGSHERQRCISWTQILNPALKRKTNTIILHWLTCGEQKAEFKGERSPFVEQLSLEFVRQVPDQVVLLDRILEIFLQSVHLRTTRVRWKVLPLDVTPSNYTRCSPCSWSGWTGRRQTEARRGARRWSSPSRCQSLWGRGQEGRISSTSLRPHTLAKYHRRVHFISVISRVLFCCSLGFFS